MKAQGLVLSGSEPLADGRHPSPVNVKKDCLDGGRECSVDAGYENLKLKTMVLAYPQVMINA